MSKFKYNHNSVLEPATLQSSSMIWLQEIMSRLDDIQKLRGLFDLEQMQICKQKPSNIYLTIASHYKNMKLRRDISNDQRFKQEIEDYFSQIEENEGRRLNKEQSNLFILQRLTQQELKRFSKQAIIERPKDQSILKARLKLDSRDSY